MSLKATNEKEILARYGIADETETVREYAGIEAIESGYGVRKVLFDLDNAMGAAMDADDGWKLNPWFNNRQIGIINSYMDGQFGTPLLTSESNPRHAICECDALLGHLVAACDSDFGNTWKERLEAIRRDALDPLPPHEIRGSSEFAPDENAKCGEKEQVAAKRPCPPKPRS